MHELDELNLSLTSRSDAGGRRDLVDGESALDSSSADRQPKPVVPIPIAGRHLERRCHGGSMRHVPRSERFSRLLQDRSYIVSAARSFIVSAVAISPCSGRTYPQRFRASSVPPLASASRSQASSPWLDGAPTRPGQRFEPCGTPQRSDRCRGVP